MVLIEESREKFDGQDLPSTNSQIFFTGRSQSDNQSRASLREPQGRMTRSNDPPRIM